MKKSLFLIFFFISTSAWATTWWIRDGGGTNAQCWGQTNATYPSATGVVVAAATNLKVDASTNTKVTSATHNFVTADVGGIVQVTSGTGWTPGYYTIGSVSSNAAILNSSPAAVNTGSGHWLEVEPCAFSHPAWLLGVCAGSQGCSSGALHTTGVMKTNDTLDMVGDSDTTWQFEVSGISVAPQVGDEYTNNGQTFTVKVVSLSGINNASGAGFISASSGIGLSPGSSGTLTIVSGHGSGDSTISFSNTMTAQAQYDLASVNLPNTQSLGCNGGGCTMNQMPFGVTSSAMTSMIGIGTDQPQLFDGPLLLNALYNPGGASGTLTRATGSGDSTISFTAHSTVYYPTYKMVVSSITTPPSAGDVYTKSGWTGTVKSVVVSGGSGNIVFNNLNYISPPPVSGTLTRSSGSGDATITYSSIQYSDYYFTVSGVTSAPLPGDTYTFNGNTFDVVSSNISSGSGTLQLNAELNLDIENIEITDHSSCLSGGVISATNPGYSVYPSTCGGTSSPTGIFMDGSNITIKNTEAHGNSGDEIIFLGEVSNFNSTNFKVIGGGADLDNGGTMSFGGTNTMNGDVWAFGGCGEKYPVPDPTNVRDLNNYLNCHDDGSGGGIGGGFMMQFDGDRAPCGNWTIDNSQFLYNMKTNIDLLHCDGTGNFNMYHSISEGSTGESLKVQMLNVNLEFDQLLGNAAAWSTSTYQAIKAPYSSTGGSWNFDICRGQANTIFSVNNNMKINYLNDDLEGNCDSLVETSNLFNYDAGVGCSGMAITAYNTKFFGGYDHYNHKTLDWYADNSTGYANCSTPVPLTDDYNSLYNLQGSFGGYGCSGMHGAHDQCVDPKLIFEVGTQIPSMVGPTAYYSGSNLASEIYLQQTSPLIAAGSTTGLTYTNSIGSQEDLNLFSNPNTPPATDQSAVFYGSPDACLSIGSGCTVGSNCCSQYCISGVCSYCIPNGQSASQASNCCSDLISGGICQQYICGDGIVTSPEVCDTSGPNLNNQTCASQGYAGGSLSCNSNCLSFNTSSCTPSNVQVSGKVRFSGNMSIN